MISYSFNYKFLISASLDAMTYKKDFFILSFLFLGNYIRIFIKAYNIFLFYFF